MQLRVNKLVSIIPDYERNAEEKGAIKRKVRTGAGKNIKVTRNTLHNETCQLKALFRCWKEPTEHMDWVGEVTENGEGNSESRLPLAIQFLRNMGQCHSS